MKSRRIAPVIPTAIASQVGRFVVENVAVEFGHGSAFTKKRRPIGLDDRVRYIMCRAKENKTRILVAISIGFEGDVGSLAAIGLSTFGIIAEWVSWVHHSGYWLSLLFEPR